MIIKMALRNLKRNHRRSFAIILTIALGVGALFLYHGFNTGIMNQYKFNTIRSRFGHGQINEKNYRLKVYEKPWDHWIDNFTSIEKVLKNDPHVNFIFPRIEFYAMLTNGKINVAGRGQGIDGISEGKFFSALNFIEGKNLSDEDNGVILGAGLARSLDVKIGDRVTVLTNTIFGSLNAADLQLVGIFHTGVKEFDDASFRLPLKQAQTLLDTQKIETIALGLKDESDDKSWDEVKSVIESNFLNLEATPFAVLDEVYYQHAVDFLWAQFGAIRLIILVIVILGIFNTISTAILERKQEIGNLRANGESKKDVMKLLLAEGLIAGIFGSLLGIILSYLLNATLLRQGILMPPSPGITRQFHVFVELQASYLMVTVLLGIACTMLGTYFAGRKVVQTQIGELLRSL